MARRLDAVCPLHIDEAVHGEPLTNGRVYVAPGGQHMTVVHGSDGPAIALEHSAPVWGVRPAADVLFRSAAAVFGRMTVAVVLTGMGRDGADGARAIRAAGGRALVQDRDSATIFGMPQATLQLAGADRISSLAEIGVAISELLEAVPHVP